MKNFPIIITSGDYKDKTFWISRSVAVVTCLFKIENRKIYVLANKRGEGTPDFQGYWNLPCGYVDFGETTKQAAIREVYEETGIELNPNDIYFTSFDDSPDSNLQNITFRYTGTIIPDTSNSNLQTRGGEEKEVEDIIWIDIDTIKDYKWAFNHEDLINDNLMNFKC